jgi:hypothetical protein
VGNGGEGDAVDLASKLQTKKERKGNGQEEGGGPPSIFSRETQKIG